MSGKCFLHLISGFIANIFFNDDDVATLSTLLLRRVDVLSQAITPTSYLFSNINTTSDITSPIPVSEARVCQIASPTSTLAGSGQNSFLPFSNFSLTLRVPNLHNSTTSSYRFDHRYIVTCYMNIIVLTIYRRMYNCRMNTRVTLG